MSTLNSIHRGDFLKKSALLKGHSFDVAIADPPYNIGKDFGNGSDNRKHGDYLSWSSQWIDICLDHLADHGVLYVYGFPEILAHVAVRYPRQQQKWLVWHYTNKTVPSSRFWQRSHESVLCLWNGRRPKLNVDPIREDYTEHYKKCIGRPRKNTKGRYSGKGRKTVYAGHRNGALPRDVIKVSALAGGAGRKQRWFLCRDCGNKAFPPEELSDHSGHKVLKHPTQKPMELTRRLIRSTISGKGKALIPFCGSGSECVVAHGLGVDFFTTELNGDYVRLARKWLAHEKRRGGGQALVVMYRLTPRMVQLLRKSLGKYHELFFGGRCSGWQLEELIVASINSDTQAQHKAMWKEAGHDHEADITVDTGGGNMHPIQVKSGKHSESLLTLSGHRLGRYRGSLEEITKFLNSPKADVLSVPYRQENDGEGRKHVYSVWYIDAEKFSGLDPDAWDDKGSCFEQSNREGVLFSLRPSMSWQVWWKIPLSLIDRTDEFSIS